METESFVPALLELRQSRTDTVISQLSKLFTEITRMNPQQVTAGYQTVRCTAESCGLLEDVAVKHVLKAFHQRMVALVNADLLDQNDNANTFCSLLGIEPEYRHSAKKDLAKFQL